MKKKNLIATLLLALLSVLLTFAASKSSLFSQFELKSIDFRFLLRGKQTPVPEVAVIGIDDASLDRFGRWPWPRSYHGELLNILSQNPPRTVGFDFLFSQKDEENPEFDQALIYYSRLLGNVVFANFFELDEEESKGGEYLRKSRKEQEKATLLLEKRALPHVEGDPAMLRQAVQFQLPFPELLHAGGTGFINAPRDPDGVIRKVPLALAYKGKVYPSFSLQLLLNFWKCDAGDVRVLVGKGIEIKTRKGVQFIPTDEKGNLLINYVGEHDDFTNALFVQVLNSAEQLGKGETPDIDLDRFWKKIILVALTATGTTDMGAFPLSGHSPLIAIHANALNTILTRNYLREASWIFKLLILAGMGLLVLLISSSLPPLKSVIVSLVLLVGFSLGNYLAFLQGWILPFVLPVLLWILIYFSITSYRYFSEEKEKRYVRKAFGQYVSGNILEELLRDPSKLKLGGERRELTVLFSDVRGFTTFCESRDPEEVVEVLNEYLDKMTEVVFKHNGTIDKYVGDAIVSFFGAPSPEIETDHAIRACRAALEMIEELKKLQEKWKAQGKEPLSNGVGINTGPMLVGNMGSTRQFDYTVIGDNVNLGARLEGQTRKFDCNIIISEMTYQQVQNQVEVRQLGEVTVKGKHKPVHIYELIRLK